MRRAPHKDSKGGEIVKKQIEAFLVAAALAGCANPSIVNVNSSNQTAPASIIDVTRFEGSPEFVEEGTDMFVAELQGHTHAKVVQGDAVRSEDTDVLAGGNIAPTDEATAAAKAAGAQVVVVGKLTSYSGKGMLNGFATVRAIDVATGKVIASIHRPSGLLIGNSEHQAVLAATKRAADDIAKAVK
jgi:hypothetical protein